MTEKHLSIGHHIYNFKNNKKRGKIDEKKMRIKWKMTQSSRDRMKMIANMDGLNMDEKFNEKINEQGKSIHSSSTNFIDFGHKSLFCSFFIHNSRVN